MALENEPSTIRLVHRRYMGWQGTYGVLTTRFARAQASSNEAFDRWHVCAVAHRTA
jgi:hypothetical protein